jgi:cytochrome c-type biogenesis protein CcmF
MGVGQSTHVGPYKIHYEHASAAVVSDPAHTGSTLNLGAVLRVTEHGRYVATLNPSEGFYDSGEVASGSVSHLIAGQSVSHISMSAGLTRDVWSAVQPDINTPALQKIIEAGNKTIPLTRPDEGLIALAYMAHAYLQHPPPAQFNFVDSPLVMWIWFGGLIVFGGGLVVLWPAPSVVRRRVSERSRARAARGLARA